MASFVLGAALVLAGAGEARAGEVRVAYGGAGVGATAYVMSGGLAELVSKQAKGVKMTAQATRGFEENVRLVDSGEVDFGMVSTVLLDQALKGEKPYTKKHESLRAVAVAIVSPVQWVTYKKTGIRTMADLKAKRVNMGPVGSSSAYMAGLTLEPYGLQDAVRKSFLNWAEGARALQDGKLDAFSITGAAPFPAVVEAAAAGEIHMITMDPDGVKKIGAKYPTLFGYTIKKGTYRGQEEDALTVAYAGYTIAHKNVPAPVVHEVLRVMMTDEGRKQLVTVHKGWEALALNPGFDALKAIGLRLHPGAEQYWKEKGHAVPPEIAAR
jgi:hypothetical protein